jgi:hypothetical protein
MPRTALPPIAHERIRDVIDRVVGSFLADGRLQLDEADDVRSTVMLRVLQQFDMEAVRSVDDYVARMTINAANDVMRARRRAPMPLLDEANAAVDDMPEPQEALATRQMLALLLNEIRLLPVMQRRALLLQIRDESGSSAIPLLVFTGVATLDEIAAALEYERAEIELLWDRLPLADLEIAALLGTTRQQVITLRRTARERLERARTRLARPRLRR